MTLREKIAEHMRLSFENGGASMVESSDGYWHMDSTVNFHELADEILALPELKEVVEGKRLWIGGLSLTQGIIQPFGARSYKFIGVDGTEWETSDGMTWWHDESANQGSDT